MTTKTIRLTALAFAAIGTACAAPAMAAHMIIYAPGTTATTQSSAQAGSQVPGSTSTVTNGTVITSVSAPNGGTTASGNATQAASESFQNGGFIVNQNGVSVFQNIRNDTSTSVNLATGLLKASSTSTDPSFFGATSGFTSAGLQDTIFFTNTAATALVATITYAFDGVLVDSPAGTISPGGNLGFDVSCAFFHCFNGQGQGIQFATGPTTTANSGMNYYFDFDSSIFGENIFGGQGSAPFFQTHLNAPNANGIVDGYIRTSVLVPTGQTSLGLRAFLNLSCRGGGQCNFGNTGALSFGPLPSGLSYTSASGAFLTGLGGGAVPEPATWAMMILGFGLIGGAMRQRGAAARIRVAYA